MIHVELSKAPCGTLQAALLFWGDMSACLRELGFEANLYDFCAVNKEVNG